MAGAIRYLNTHTVKENVKDVLGSVTFAVCVWGLYKTGSSRKSSDADWKKAADKTIIFFLKSSIVLSCIASRPGLQICDWVIHSMISRKALADIFGLNTIFEFNPGHPRHILNIGANVLSALAFIKWVFDRYVPNAQPVPYLVAIGTFNFVFGRSTLHIVNQACRRFFRS
jgi:hypothetical protein